LKERGLNPDNVEWFVNGIETYVIKLRASGSVPKPSEQGSDCASSTTKVGKRFAGYQDK